MTKKELQDNLMKMPELEEGHQVAPIIKEIFKEKDELIHKRKKKN